MKPPYDVVIAGAGLAGSLTAYRIRQKNPKLRLLLLDRDDSIATHTWSFHSSDLSDSNLDWMRPLISKSWDAYSVHFPGCDRVLAGGYHSIRSEDFLEKSGLESVRQRGEVQSLSLTQATLATGETFTARVVIDARGFLGQTASVGFQKFLGLDVTLKEAHHLKHVTLMDARCDQTNGYRFFYLLPWSERTLLIEDTYYSTDSAIDEGECEAEIRKYCQSRGWQIEAISRREKGALPIPLAQSQVQDPSERAPILIGVRAGLFHPVTGYSLPWAVKLADQVAECLHLNPKIEPAELRKRVQGYVRSEQRGNSFLRFLNRMLLLGAKPAERIRVMARFYLLPQTLIENFYAGKLSRRDQFRILAGKPPIPIHRALGCILRSTA